MQTLQGTLAATHGSLSTARLSSSPSSFRGSQLRLSATPRPGLPSRVLKSVVAVSVPEEHMFGHHRLQDHGPPARELTPEQKQQRVDEETERIRRQTEMRSQKLQNEAHMAHLDHELKFGKMMFAQGSYDSALAHFENVVQGSKPDTYFRGEGTLQKAACLEKLGREAEAKLLYESLIRFRAPYPNIKRRAAQALFGTTSEPGQAPNYDDYMYRMFLSGFGSYMPKEKYVETKEEKVVMGVLPWAMLAMAPLLLVYLLVIRQ